MAAPTKAPANVKKVLANSEPSTHGTGINVKKGRLPKSRLDFWIPKIEGNRARDIRKQEALTSKGWKFLVVWQCELENREVLIPHKN